MENAIIYTRKFNAERWGANGKKRWIGVVGCEGCYPTGWRWKLLKGAVGFRTLRWWVEFPWLHSKEHLV